MRVSTMSMTALAAASQAAALSQADRAAAVKNTFQIAWDGYYKNAFPHDELHPLDNTYDDDFGGWGASAIDGFSTAIVMGHKEIVNQILDFVPTIDFTSSNQTIVSLFETTIRYLGGLLSAYDLLTGPAAHLVDDQDKVKAILTQATSLADTLSYAFDTKTGIPVNNLALGNHSTDGSTTAGIAQAGTLVLEWTRLSDLTGNDTYGKLAQKAESYILRPKPSWAQPFPGLVGSTLDIASGEFTDNYVTWNGGDDSYYEYLIKFWLYDSQYTEYRDTWLAAANSTISELISHPESRPDLTFVNIWNNGTVIKTSEHLTGFIGGNFLLAGSVLKDQQLLDTGLAFTESWHQTYNGTATHIGPEVFAWDKEGVPASQSDFYEKNGFYITTSTYVLRPEVVESFYYAWRITGDEKYRDWVWDAYLAVNSTCFSGSGYSGLSNVNAPHGGSLDNLQESFLFAEVLKYMYLTQADDAEWQVQADGSNKFVFNTEAHPIRIKA
ncbi:mannosyl-oligosaccharide alpha-1,2-mannosidase [Talaromyces islandicus]|uniref:alpha-1,2-Mannosidase n=1 Tax=Talaromyces islandicus TaxID=28573 RepID=A0A0U1M1A2_TALIS|nr:mannosyl-oligosaccharide alpha-1,2-mannosidase [Talaromyces islandicus]